MRIKAYFIGVVQVKADFGGKSAFNIYFSQ